MTMAPEEVTRAIALFEDGCSIRYIANVLGVARNTVHDGIKCYQETGEYSRRLGSGRPRAKNNRGDRVIVLTMLLDLIDSSTKFPTAKLWGNEYDFGNYDECLSVDVNEEWGAFFGQHCITEIPNSFDKVFNGQHSNVKKRFRWLTAFSWYKNGKSLFSLKSQPDSIGVLHGIRFFSISWVVLGHSSVLREFFPQKNTIPITAWRFLCLTDSVLAVDSFFLLSGTLLCYIFMKTMDKGHPFNLYLFYLHRFIRVFPVLGLMVLLETSILAKIGNGPLWDYAVCIPVAWFLSVDMQLYLLSPIFLLALYKKPKLGIGLLAGCGLIGIFITFQQAYTFRDRASNLRTRGRDNDRYYQTHTRYVPWLIGLACGYLLFRTTEWRNRTSMGAEYLSKLCLYDKSANKKTEIQ
ncbi:hypothetical protein C0J52_05792 [Blattella germanica]|nr:hypothetical protein C0J52_05792 [Blattella germanica]